jgi:signal transduction histidine kinase/PAS domain-containing protein
MAYSFSEHLKQNLYKNPSPVIKVKLDGTIDFFNRAFIKVAGLTAEQVKELPGTSAVPVLGKLIWQCLDFVKKPEQQDGTLPKFVFPQEMTRAEKRLWSLAVAQSTEDNVLDGMICTLIEPEVEKQDGFKMLENILSGSPGAMVVCTPEFELRGVNQNFVDLLGAKVDDYKGKSLSSLIFDFEDFKRTFQQNSGRLAFSCVLQNVHKDAIFCGVFSNSLSPHILSKSEHSGVSKLYYVIQFLPLDEQQSQIVEVLNGKNLSLLNRLAELKKENEQLRSASASVGSVELLTQVTALQADLEKLRKEKEELTIQFQLLSTRYRNEKQNCQLEKGNILLVHQEVLREKQCLLDEKNSLAEQLARVQNQITEFTEALQKAQDEKFSLVAKNDRLQVTNDNLQVDHKNAIQLLKANHLSDLNKLAVEQQTIVAAERQSSAEALAALRQECNTKITDTEQSHQSVCVAYEKAERDLAVLRKKLAGSISADLLSGAVSLLDQISGTFSESLDDFPPELATMPAVKNMLAAQQDLARLINNLCLFSNEFKKLPPPQCKLLETCQAWQEEFARRYPSLDLFFKYPVDGEEGFYDLQVMAILRELVENAAEATANQAGAEVKVKIQIKSPGEMAQCHFKKEILQKCLLVQVVDSGELMFDPEQVIKPYHTNKVGHLGLGLSIVRFLLESLGGELELRSTPNGGVASFYLPLL